MLLINGRGCIANNDEIYDQTSIVNPLQGKRGALPLEILFGVGSGKEFSTGPVFLYIFSYSVFIIIN